MTEICEALYTCSQTRYAPLTGLRFLIAYGYTEAEQRGLLFT